MIDPHLKDVGRYAPTPIDRTSSQTRPSDTAASSSKQANISLAPEDNNDSRTKGKAKDTNEAERRSSTSTSMGPPGWPASATRGKKRRNAGRRAVTRAPSPLRKSWSADDLSAEQDTPDARSTR